jgi:hypothetical protein
MKHQNDFESDLWKLVERENLADLSQFHKPRFKDEIPLYSRLSDISFLSHCRKVEANAILLRFAMKYLMSVIAYEEHRTTYFAAITVWNYSAEEPIVPNLFVWFDALSDLRAKLSLDPVKSAFAKKTRQVVTGLRLSPRFEVFEENSTMPDLSRVFIGPSVPHYPSFVVLAKLRKAASAAKR